MHPELEALIRAYDAARETRGPNAVKLRALFENRLSEFNQQVEALLAGNLPRDAANQFNDRLRESWPWAEIGFVVSLDGSVLAPSLFAGSAARKFRLENDRFLCSRETVDVYWNSP